MAPRSSPPGGTTLEPLAFALHRGALHLLRRLRDADRAAPVGPAQLSALSVLVFGGPRTPAQLAAIEQVSRPTMTRIVAGLARAGLAERTAHPVDGRAVVMRATPAGTRLMHRARARRVAILTRTLARLDADERAVLERASGLMARLATDGRRRGA